MAGETFEPTHNGFLPGLGHGRDNYAQMRSASLELLHKRDHRVDFSHRHRMHPHGLPVQALFGEACRQPSEALRQSLTAASLREENPENTRRSQRQREVIRAKHETTDEITRLGRLFRGFNKEISSVPHLIQRSFQFHPLRLDLIAVGLLRNPYRAAPDEAGATEWHRHFKTVPACKEFFFEAAKVSGRIGSPVSFASTITPDWA